MLEIYQNVRIKAKNYRNSKKSNRGIPKINFKKNFLKYFQ